MHKIGQLGGFLGRFLTSLLKTGLPLMKNVLKLLAKSVLIPLGLPEATLTTDAAICKKMSGQTTLIISNEGMNNIMEIVKSLEETGLLIKGVRETTQNEAIEQKREFIAMLLGTLGASLLRNLLTHKCTVRACQDFQCRLML